MDVSQRRRESQCKCYISLLARSRQEKTAPTESLQNQHGMACTEKAVRGCRGERIYLPAFLPSSLPLLSLEFLHFWALPSCPYVQSPHQWHLQEPMGQDLGTGDCLLQPSRREADQLPKGEVMLERGDQASNCGEQGQWQSHGGADEDGPN